MGRGLLVAAFDFSTAHADEFHDWYDLEHMPERKAIPGFGACERWIGDEQPAVSVATYDLESVDVLRGKGLRIHRLRQPVGLVEARDRDVPTAVAVRGHADRPW
jgi:hypothetical protein